MDNLKWIVVYVILVTSVSCTISQDLWENCTSSSGNLSNGNGVTCDFQNDVCGWENDPENRVDWIRAYSSGNSYLKLSMSNLTYNHPARVKSRWKCFSDTNMYYLRFKYHVVLPFYCHLHVYVNTTKGEILLWTLKDSTDLYFVQSPNITFNSSNCVFQIIFEGYKTDNVQCGFYNEIRIDDITLTPLPQTSSCDKLTTSVPVTSTSSPSAAISHVMTTQPSSAQSSIFTTMISDSSQSVTCDFQNDVCDWENVSENLVNWTRVNSRGNQYLKLSMSDLTYNQPARVKSRWQCFSDTNMYYLRFKYHVVPPFYCHLHVYVNTTRGEFLLWTVNKDSGLYFDQSPNITFNSSNCVFQIIFEGYKTGNAEYQCGNYNEIRIDDIIVTPMPRTSSCDKLMTPVPVTSTSSLSAAISYVMTTHPSSAQSNIFTTMISDSTQSGNNSEKEINEKVGTGLTTGAIAGIAVSILIIVIVIIVIITYKRHGSDICDMHEKQLKRNTKTDTSNMNSLEGELHQDEQIPVNNARMYPGDGELEEKKNDYEVLAAHLTPQYCTLTYNTGTKDKGPLPVSRNCHNGNPDNDYINM